MAFHCVFLSYHQPVRDIPAISSIWLGVVILQLTVLISLLFTLRSASPDRRLVVDQMIWCCPWVCGDWERAAISSIYYNLIKPESASLLTTVRSWRAIHRCLSMAIMLCCTKVIDTCSNHKCDYYNIIEICMNSETSQVPVRDDARDCVWQGQGYTTPRGVMIDGYGAMVNDDWLETAVNSDKLLLQCHLINCESHTKSPRTEHQDSQLEAGVCHRELRHDLRLRFCF
jgi:hypothetical protein